MGLLQHPTLMHHYLITSDEQPVVRSCCQQLGPAPHQAASAELQGFKHSEHKVARAAHRPCSHAAPCREQREYVPPSLHSSTQKSRGRAPGAAMQSRKAEPQGKWRYALCQRQPSSAAAQPGGAIAAGPASPNGVGLGVCQRHHQLGGVLCSDGLLVNVGCADLGQGRVGAERRGQRSRVLKSTLTGG